MSKRPSEGEGPQDINYLLLTTNFKPGLFNVDDRKVFIQVRQI